MVSINTSDDLIQVIRENPDFRATVRRELLTEELLEAPGRLQTLTTTVRDLVSDMRELQATVRELSAAVRELRATVEGHSTILEGQSATIRGLTDSMVQLRGDVLESKLTGRILPLIAREFDVRRVYPICSGGLPPMNPRMEEFERTLEEAADDGKITDDDETRLRVTDLIVRSQRRSDRSTLWFAIEASGVIDDYDITRAKHSADVLREIHAQDAIPLVYGYQISDRYRDLANALQVSVFLDSDRQ